MHRQRFQVKYLRALGGQRLQQPRLARARGAANHPVAVLACQHRQVGHQSRPEGLVAAINQRDLEADLVEDERQRTAALAAAPAVHQRSPVAWFADHIAFDMRSDVFCDQCRAAFFGVEGADLLVFGADQLAFVVVQTGPVDGAGQVVFGVFALAAGVDDVGKTAEGGQCGFGGNAFQAHGISFFNSGQTLASILACACSFG